MYDTDAATRTADKERKEYVPPAARGGSEQRALAATYHEGGARGQPDAGPTYNPPEHPAAAVMAEYPGYMSPDVHEGFNMAMAAQYAKPGGTGTGTPFRFPNRQQDGQAPAGGYIVKMCTICPLIGRNPRGHVAATCFANDEVEMQGETLDKYNAMPNTQYHAAHPVHTHANAAQATVCSVVAVQGKVCAVGQTTPCVQGPTFADPAAPITYNIQN